MKPLRKRSVCFALFGLLGTCLLAPAKPTVNPQPAPQQPPAPQQGINVLILGDSLGLCGFGKRLDDLFRDNPQVKSTYTYMACGTNPLSWLKERPYAKIQTHCGFMSIEPAAGSGRAKELLDVYGMRRGATPKAHPIPKLEDLLATVRPDILIMQTGTNLFDLFPDRKTVSPHRHGPALRSYLMPFVSTATRSPSTLRKIYWVASPTSGRASKEVQDFVLERIRADIGNVANVIDSRTLVAYPYRHMEPDKEHFIGADQDQWAEKVFGIIEQDLSQQPLAALKPLAETPPTPAPMVAAAPSASPAPAPPAEKPKEAETLQVTAKLVSKTPPIPAKELLPYQEYLVGYVYDVTGVIAGQYSEKQILVMHPAYIGLRRQKLSHYRIGKTYKLKLREVEGTVWKSVKSKDDSGLINLQPYIRVQDEERHPENAN
jgi:hypothetical protein